MIQTGSQTDIKFFIKVKIANVFFYDISTHEIDFTIFVNNILLKITKFLKVSPQILLLLLYKYVFVCTQSKFNLTMISINMFIITFT